MAVFDCITYFEEREVLKIRFEELDVLVDTFIIVEATETFRGNPKTHYYKDFKDEFSEWEDKIVVHTIDFPKSLVDPWDRETYQRRAIKTVLKGVAQPSDTILVSDADEIPRASAVASLMLANAPVYFDVDQYYWNYNWQVPAHCNMGARPYAIRYKYLTDPHDLRVHEKGERIPKAGWHFSYLGNWKDNERKIEAFSHEEYDKPEYKDLSHMLKCWQEGIDPFGRFPLKWIEIDESYPLYIQRLTHDQ